MLHTTKTSSTTFEQTETDAFLVCAAWVVFLFDGYERNFIRHQKNKPQEKHIAEQLHARPRKLNFFSTLRLPPHGTFSLSLCVTPKHEFIRITDRVYCAFFTPRMHVFFKTHPPATLQRRASLHSAGCSRSLSVSKKQARAALRKGPSSMHKSFPRLFCS